ncbi:hypothetical protein GW17_00033810 [Ensete ventricosum]|nr:hypothetical protein GW17_00033810 [Ensete ventricosum]
MTAAAEAGCREVAAATPVTHKVPRGCCCGWRAGDPPQWASLVWLCGSLSDLIVQPLVGHQSDRCASPLGRLRPYIAGGAAAIVASVLLIGYSADISHALGDPADGGTRHRAIADYLLGFWLLDVGNNTTQGPCSALLADLTGLSFRCSPPSSS